MDILNLRLWIVFYLICFVAVLWATFLLVQGAMLWVSIGMVSIVIGFNCLLLVLEIRSQMSRRRSMEEISDIVRKEQHGTEPGPGAR